mmetsp:Transcript_8519/g.26221  ORF Transcript_8519/g.26221 Transcript_8519/m.26221 type:complete len:1010 (+) Transcript_8519:198-3227(+)
MLVLRYDVRDDKIGAGSEQKAWRSHRCRFDATLGYPGEGPDELSQDAQDLLGLLAATVRTKTDDKSTDADVKVKLAEFKGDLENKKVGRLLDSLMLRRLVKRPSRGSYALTREGVLFCRQTLPSPSPAKPPPGKRTKASYGDTCDDAELLVSEELEELEEQHTADEAYDELNEHSTLDSVSDPEGSQREQKLRRHIEELEGQVERKNAEIAMLKQQLKEKENARRIESLNTTRVQAALSKAQADLSFQSQSALTKLRSSVHHWDHNTSQGTVHHFDNKDKLSFSGTAPIIDEDDADGGGEDTAAEAPDDEEQATGGGYAAATAPKLARNVVCRLWAYSRTDRNGTSASAGRVADLLLKVFRRLKRHVPAAVELFMAEWNRNFSTETLIVNRLKDALDKLKMLSNYSDDDLKAYHAVLTAVAPPLVTSSQRKLGKLGPIGRHLGIAAFRKSKAGKKRTTPFQKAQQRRDLIDRLDKGDIRVGDEVTYRQHGGKDGTRLADREDRVANVKKIETGANGSVKLTLNVDVLGELEDVETKSVRAPWWPQVDRASGKLPEAIAKDIVTFCETELPTSPSKRDYRRKWIARNQFICHSAHFLMCKKEDLWKKFREKYPQHKIEMSTFKKHLPWWVTKGKQDTCLCGCCENMTLLLKALNDNAPLVHRACVASGACPPDDGDTEGVDDVDDDDGDSTEESRDPMDLTDGDANQSGDDASTRCCAFCQAARISSKKELRKCDFSDMWSSIRSAVVEDRVVEHGSGKRTTVESSLRATLSPEEHELWSSRVQWSAHKSEREGAELDASSAHGGGQGRGGNTETETADSEFDDSEFSASSVGGRKRTDQRIYEDELWRFLDHFSGTLVKYKKHRTTLDRPKEAHLLLDQNYRPGTLVGDIDFAENYDIRHLREIQSQHWSHNQMTLFISIFKYLVTNDFNKTSGKIKAGEKVTCERAGVSIFAKVVGGDGEFSDSIYHVETGRRSRWSGDSCGGGTRRRSLTSSRRPTGSTTRTLSSSF